MRGMYKTLLTENSTLDKAILQNNYINYAQTTTDDIYDTFMSTSLQKSSFRASRSKTIRNTRKSGPTLSQKLRRDEYKNNNNAAKN